MRVLIVRPEPGNAVTAARVTAMGHEAVCVPLFAVGAVAWDAPDPAGFDAVAMTSANATRFGGAGLARYRHLPVFAVGEATGAAARDAGFLDILVGTGDAADLGELLNKPLPFRGGVGVGQSVFSNTGLSGESVPHPNPSPEGEGLRVLHLTGADHRPIATTAAITVRTVYATTPLDPAAPLDADIALIHSPRAGERLASLVSDKTRFTLIAISPAAARACGSGWAAIHVAQAPRDDAILECLARLCEAGCLDPKSHVA